MEIKLWWRHLLANCVDSNVERLDTGPKIVSIKMALFFFFLNSTQTQPLSYYGRLTNQPTNQPFFGVSSSCNHNLIGLTLRIFESMCHCVVGRRCYVCGPIKWAEFEYRQLGIKLKIVYFAFWFVSTSCCCCSKGNQCLKSFIRNHWSVSTLTKSWLPSKTRPYSQR